MYSVSLGFICLILECVQYYHIPYIFVLTVQSLWHSSWRTYETDLWSLVEINRQEQQEIKGEESFSKGKGGLNFSHASKKFWYWPLDLILTISLMKFSWAVWGDWWEQKTVGTDLRGKGQIRKCLQCSVGNREARKNHIFIEAREKQEF